MPTHPRVIPVQTSGSSGAASGNADVNGVQGQRLDTISLDYAASAPATTVVTLSFPDMPGQPNVTFPASNTDRVSRPRVPVQQYAAPATDVAGRGEEAPRIYGRVNVAVSASNALNPAVTARLFFVD